MFRKSIATGIISGFLLTIASLYPTLVMLAPQWVTGWEAPMNLPVESPVQNMMFLGFSMFLGLGVFLLSPFVVVWRTDARSFKAGLLAGGIQGLFMGIIVCLVVVSPLNSLRGWRLLEPAFHPLVEDPQAIGSFAAHVLETGTRAIFGALGFTVIGGALLGGFYAQGRRRHLAPDAPTTLYQLTREQRAWQWLEGYDEAAKIALIIGVVVGVIEIITSAQVISLGFGETWPELSEILRTSLKEAPIVPFQLPFLYFFTILLMGGGVVYLIQNPTSRYWNRISAVSLSMEISVFIAYLQQTRVATFFIGLLPFLVARGSAEMLRVLPELYQRGMVDFDIPLPIFMSSIRMLTPIIVENLARPDVQVALHFTLPFFNVLLTSLGVLFAGLVLGSVYAVFIPLFSPRPVDRAATIRHELRRDPKQVLPAIYRLFDTDKCATDVLAHLTVGLARHKKTSDLAYLSAAYHTLSAQVDGDGRIAREIADQVAQHPEWRHAKEIGGAYYALSTVLAATSIDALLQSSPPEIDTTTLPPLLVKMIRHITDVVNEIGKVHRVDDLPTMVSFLNSSLDVISGAQRYVNIEMRDSRLSGTVYPEQLSVSAALDRWEHMVLAKIKRLKGRADVCVTLKSQHLTFASRLPLTFDFNNCGLNVAEQVYLRLLPSEDFNFLDGAEKRVEILPAGENETVDIFVEPKTGLNRLRLEWEVQYDDSIEKGRVVKDADVLEFARPEKPFQRIFPIPYVTGTPLKEGDVFVGRDDVFEFIKEHLIGTHQNNVIILHGQRRTGKTSVLYRMGKMLSTTHVAVLIDMQGKPARGTVDFLYAIADDIVYALEQQDILVDLPERKAFEEAPEFFFKSRFIRSLYAVLGDRNLLLLFDEFEELQQRVEDGRLEPGIFQFLRNLMQHEDRVDFIFAGTHKLEELGSDYWSVLFNIAIYKRITFLSPADVRRLITAPVAQYGLEYDPLALDAIAMLSAGHPYFTQLLLHELVVYHNESQRSYLTTADVEQAMGRVLERGEAHFKYIWAESTPPEQMAMRVLAEALVSRKESALTDIKNLCDTCGYTFGEPELEALGSLASRDIVTRNGKLYRFTVPLIEKWVRHTHPVMV